MVLVVPLTQLLIDAYGWRTAFRVLGLIAAAWIVPSSLWLRSWILRQREAEIRGQGRDSFALARKQNLSPDPQGSDPLTLRQAMRRQSFWLLMAAFFFGNVSSQTLHVHQVAFLVDHGLSALVAATVVGVVGFSSIFGKIGGGWLSDRLEREAVYVGGIAIMVASAFALLAIGSAPSIWAAYVYAVLLGVGYSATASLIPAMVSDRFSGRHFGAIIGVCLIGSSSGSAVGPWLAGMLYDTTGSYTAAFLIAAACGVIAGIVGWRAWSLRKQSLTARAKAVVLVD
jgi:predicted MFS family arabinose efflux permease